MSRRGRPQKPTAEELRLWRKVVSDVAPLSRRTGPTLSEDRRADQPDPSDDPRQAAPPAAPVRAYASSPPAAPARPASRARLKAGTAPDVDRRTSERLRKGRMDVDGKLDLHGLSQAQAHLALTGYLGQAQAAGRRMILVITGRGTFTGGKAVLKSRLADWLNDPPLRDKVLAFYPAQPRHGGEGAFYVLLKRLRD